MKLNFEFSDTEVDFTCSVVAHSLKEDYKRITNDLRKLRKRRKKYGLERYEETNWHDYKKIRKHIKGVLKYYLVEDDELRSFFRKNTIK